MSTPLLQLRHVTKRFGGHAALKDVSLTVHHHEVVGLIGENGAGKSTLLKLLAGNHGPDEGEILLAGEPVRLTDPTVAARHGIGVVHQEQSLVPNLRVAENLLLGREGDAVRGGLVRRRRLEERAAAALRTVASQVDPAAVTSDLTFAERQMVEIARAVATGHGDRPPLVVLDEPTSVLEQEDVGILHERITALRALGSVIFVSHRLDEVLRFSDRVYVLRDGEIVGERVAAAATEDELYRLMIGRESAGGFYDADRAGVVDRSGTPVLELADLHVRGAVHGVSLTVHPGEILGLVGVAGSGREELARAVFGAVPVRSGEIRLGGAAVRPRSPAAAVRSGVAYVPAERRTEGMIAGASVAENITLVHPRSATSTGISTAARRAAIARRWIERLAIRPPDPDTDIARLSGGNQQKAAIARWLQAGAPRLLVLDHPTRGLDIGAKEDLYRLFRELCAEGTAILLLADTLDEAIGLSHRIVSLRDGSVTGEFGDGAEHPGTPTPLQLLETMM
ncbi:sugar ABC transporter ATP-binding protein [Pseudonocardia sp. WMMC193]|uniref:sugar ABC transporter ATP-binding protein n=1 Tax=Pseudonocardia sp. WMMC193 TaxID=2911965 RepID=UPI001F31E6F3|nr:sugar ABC transporter ATP-binding protein [Pseudonocardia sp. WMMC193]MCF7548612.1 sugar ABC transporter ATP-binding protein [Pseudonocardia sp. WMMC193]